MPLPGAARPASCSDTGRHQLPRSPQPCTEAGPIPLAQTAAAPALPCLSSRRAGEMNAAAPGTRRGATPRLKVVSAPGDSRGSALRRAALPPGGTAPQEEARAEAPGRDDHPPPRRPGIPQPLPSRRCALPFASALPQNGGRRPPRAASTGHADWLQPPSELLLPAPFPLVG